MKKRKDIVFFKKSTSCTFVTLNFLVCTAPFLFPIYLDDFATFLAMGDKKLEGPQKVQLWSLPTRCNNIFMKNTQLKWKIVSCRSAVFVS